MLTGIKKIKTKEKSEDSENNKLEKTDVVRLYRKVIFNFLACVCIFLFCASLAPKELQNDTFYTIKVGQFINENGIDNLTEDPFSWHELPYTFPHWLYDLMMYKIYSFGGHFGIYLSTMIFYGILGMLVYRLSLYKSKNEPVSFIVTCAFMYLIRTYVAARAQLVTFILFTLEVLFIEKFLDKKKGGIIYAFFLLLIPLLIANLHCAVFPFYFVLALPYIGEYLLEVIVDWDLDLRLKLLFIKIFKKLLRNPKLEKLKNKALASEESTRFDISERKRKRGILRSKPYKIKVRKNHRVLLLIVIMLLATLTGLLNPAGDGAYTYLYKTMQGTTTKSINEHLPVVLAESEEFFITLVFFLAIMIFTDTKIRLCDLFMLGGLTYLSLRSRRQISMFALFTAPILAKMIADMFYKYDRITYKKVIDFFSGAYGATILILAFILVFFHFAKPKIHADYINEREYPVQAAEWMISNLDVDNIRIYNDYNFGSYLVLKGIPVFIDSRCDLYTPEFNGNEKEGIKGRNIFADALDIAAIAVNHNDKFKEYGVTHVISYSNSKLCLTMDFEPDKYRNIYKDDYFKVYEIITEDSNEGNEK